MESKGEVLIFESPENGLDIQVRLENDTLWLSQRLMAELFEKDSDTIGLHIKNIYTEGELEEEGTTELFSVVQTEGSRQVTRQVKFYNLDVIISVGYRVNSKRGTQFRIWATQRLKDYLIRGYTLNEKRLKQPKGRHISNYHLKNYYLQFPLFQLAYLQKYLRVEASVFVLAALWVTSINLLEKQ